MVPDFGRKKNPGPYGISRQLHVFIQDLCSSDLNYLYIVLQLFALLIPMEALPVEAGPRWLKTLLRRASVSVVQMLSF